jgi:transposase-like protein
LLSSCALAAEGKAVSDLCEKHHIHPTVFYQWQRQFFENGTAAFESKQSRSRVSDGYIWQLILIVRRG